MKGCIIFFGESFRLGGQGSRIRGSDESFEQQIKASKSHMIFIDSLRMKQTETDIYIASYNTKFKQDLQNIYAENLIGSDFYDELIGQENLIHNSINKILNIDKYDFLTTIRIDIFLKSHFIEIFNPKWNKILWSCICWDPANKVNGKHPRVNDLIMYFSRKYFKYIKDVHYDDNTSGHKQWAFFIDNTDLTYDDLDTIINTFHDSDSAKDYNPLYYIVNREECQIHHTPGGLFIKSDY
jgi:hypothetical protein